MGVHDAYLDRMASRIDAFERELRGAGEELLEARHRRDLEAGLATLKERFQVLRRSGAEVTEEMTQSFTQSFERLRASFGEWRKEAA